MVSDVTRAGLARHTTLRLGGPAGDLVEATDQHAIVAAIRAGGPDDVLILAGGSNVVIADAGFPGRVVLVRSSGITVYREDSAVRLTVAAGHPWDDVVSFAVSEGLAGVECLAGIPGSAGATPIQNVGAYGQEVSETIVGVQVYDRVTDSVSWFTPTQCGFAYRTSVFKHVSRWVVLAVTFSLRPARLSAPLRFAELTRALGAESAPLADVRAAVVELRRAKGMVLDPYDPDTYSVGSFFTNPVLAPDAFALLRERALAAVGAEPPAWPAPDGVKTSAAWLIERAGFHRGFDGGHPGVALSSKHTLALTNRGSATTAALLALARDIRDGVRKSFEVELHPEPVLINCTL
ncbi:MAG: UDP-N-acetylmuramate dehydrogenase [Betaproteobacteria bacterium]